jgi:hypothetical protein
LLNIPTKARLIEPSATATSYETNWHSQSNAYEAQRVINTNNTPIYNSGALGYNDQKSYNISTDIEQNLTSIAVYLYHEEYIASAILNYKLLNNDDTFKMVIYGFDVCYGDWDILDQYNLTKAIFVVDKVSGDTYFEEQEILSIYYR